MQSRCRIQTTGPNNGLQLRDYSKNSNRSESPLIFRRCADWMRSLTASTACTAQRPSSSVPSNILRKMAKAKLRCLPMPSSTTSRARTQRHVGVMLSNSNKIDKSATFLRLRISFYCPVTGITPSCMRSENISGKPCSRIIFPSLNS